MGRVPRVDIGDEVYHVINRANARLQIFFKEEDYQLFETILKDGAEKYDMRLLAYCVMPNRFHLVLHPKKDGDLQKFMQWLTLTHKQGGMCKIKQSAQVRCIKGGISRLLSKKMNTSSLLFDIWRGTRCEQS